MDWYVDLGTLTAFGTTKAIVVFLILRYILGWLLLPWADEIREFQVVMRELLTRIKKDIAQEKELNFHNVLLLGLLGLGPSVVQASYFIGMILLILSLSTPHG